MEFPRLPGGGGEGGNPPVGGMVLMIFGGWLSRVTSERREAFLSLYLGQEPFYYRYYYYSRGALLA